MLTQSTVISHIGVLDDGQLEVRRSRRVYDGTELIAERYHRHVLAPGDDLTTQDVRVRALATLLWTPAVVAAYRAAREAERNSRSL